MDDRKPLADLGRLVIGLFMTVAGIYLFMNQVQVRTDFWGWRYSFWGMHITAFGMTLIPFMIGVAMIFFDTRSKIGWGVAIASVMAILVGIIATLQVYFAPTTLYITLGILILVAGGLGLMIRAIKSY
jgi:uncharacterized membrane protein HdeD (DUF308 family)